MSDYVAKEEGTSEIEENYSVPNEIDGDDGTKILLSCQFCDFDIMVFVKHDRLEDVYVFDPEKMICPACDEKFEEDTIKFVQNSILKKRDWNSEKYNLLYGISATTDNKLSSWGKSNVPVPRHAIQSSSTDSDEDSISIYSDTSITKSSETELALDRSDEQEQEQESETELAADTSDEQEEQEQEEDEETELAADTSDEQEQEQEEEDEEKSLRAKFNLFKIWYSQL